jgi:hypothetical protein
MMSSFKAKFRTKGIKGTLEQVYKAKDLEDAKRQHERTTQIMQAGNPDYECNLITMSEVKDK